MQNAGSITHPVMHRILIELNCHITKVEHLFVPSQMLGLHGRECPLERVEVIERRPHRCLMQSCARLAALCPRNIIREFMSDGCILSGITVVQPEVIFSSPTRMPAENDA